MIAISLQQKKKFVKTFFGEIGAWVRQQTNVDSLKDFQANFIISPQKNKSQTEKDGEKIFLTPPLKSVPNEQKITDEQLNF